jgi:peptidoglycan/LPS O-acetylase OafA/YrhL
LSIISRVATYLHAVRSTFGRIVAYDKPADAPDGSPEGANPKPAKEGFRPDVEGLRAVAVGAVLLYHAGVPFAPGGYVGVDVFFVISGFLITGLLVRELEKTGTVSLARFYSRRAKRLLPLTVVVLAFVVAVSWPLFDPVRMDEVSLGVVASGLYVMNWLLAARATDYFAAGLQASPVQHFWTLAVEEQFYLIWPALLLCAAWWSRRTGPGLRPVLAATFAAVTILSLAYSVYATELQAGAAYFSTLTRGWELALGGARRLPPLECLARQQRLCGLRYRLPAFATAQLAGRPSRRALRRRVGQGERRPLRRGSRSRGPHGPLRRRAPGPAYSLHAGLCSDTRLRRT